MTQITSIDLSRFSQELSRGDRAGFYLDYYNLTGSTQALALAQISSFSGAAGGAASLANQIDRALVPAYPAGGVDAFSLQIATDIYDKIVLDVMSDGGTGVLTNSDLLSTAQHRWDVLGLGTYFPGNALAIQAWLTGDTNYLNSHLSDILTPGAAVGLFAGTASILSQASIDNYQSYSSFLSGIATDVFGLAPANSGNVVTSNDGRVSWQLDGNGNVKYGSVNAPGALFPATQDSLDPGVFTTRNADGTLQFHIGPDDQSGSLLFHFRSSGQLDQSEVVGADRTTTDNFDNSGQLTDSEAFYASGGTTATLYSSDPSNSWSSQTSIYNPQHQLIGVGTVNRDGTKTLTWIDPVSGKAVTSEINSDNKISGQTADPGIDYNNFVRAVADTLATQLISKFLTSNNIPATIVVQAFADATINSAINSVSGQPVDFSQELASSAFDIAGGLAGSTVGVDIAEALGLPTEAGSLVGGVTGNLVAQALVKEVFHDFTLPVSSVLDPGALANGLSSAGGAVLGSMLASALLTPTEAGQFIGSIATAAAIADEAEIAELIGLAQPELAPLAFFAIAFGSDFIGNIVGDIFSSLFGSHPSVGPNAVSVSEWDPSTGKFIVASVGEDNGASTDGVRAMGDAMNTIMGNTLAAIGGTIVGTPPVMSLEWFKGQYSYDFGTEYSPNKTLVFNTPNAAVEAAAVRWMSSLDIVNGDPYMVYVTKHSTATTLADFYKDLNSAHAYSTYIADPAAFDAALAIANDPAQFAQWQQELARAQAMGLDKLDTVQISNLVTYGVSSPWQIVNGTWDTIHSLTKTDGSPFSFGNDSVIGVATNLFNAGEYDFITKTGPSQGNSTYKVVGFDSNGHLVTSATLGVFASATAFLGTAKGIVGRQEGDILLLGPSGTIAITEFDPDHLGQILSLPTAPSVLLDDSGRYQFVLGLGSPLIGTTNNFLGRQGVDLAFLNADGHIQIYELSTNNIGWTNGNVLITDAGGHPVAFPNGVSLIGSGSSLTGAHGQSLFLRYPDGHVEWREFDVSALGKVQAGGTLTYPDGTLISVESGASLVVAGQDFTGHGGRDLLIQHVDQHVSIVEVDTTGHALVTMPLLNTDGSGFLLANNSQIVGTGANFSGSGGQDLFIREADGQLTVAEFGNNGHAIFNKTLDPGFILGATDTIIGTGANFSGNGGRDVFIREPNGQVTVWEFDANGHGVYGQTLDPNFVLGTQRAIVGTGSNFSGNNERDLFIREPNGQVTAWGFDATGHGVYGKTLDSTALLGASDTVAGTGANFSSNGGQDVFIRGAGGQITVWEFDANGHRTYGQSLDVSFALGSNDTIIGAGSNFLNNGGHDLFIRAPGGQVTVLEFDASGHSLSSKTLDSSFAAGTNISTIGTANNFYGTAGADQFFRTAGGQLGVAEFNAQGQMVAGGVVTFPNNGGPVGLDNASKVIGTGQNLFVNGGHDIFLQNSQNQLVMLELNSSNQWTFGGTLIFPDNSPVGLPGTGVNSILGTGHNLFGSGGADIFFMRSDGQEVVFELQGATVWQTGGSITTIGTGSNFYGTGGTDQFFHTAGGQLGAIEFNAQHEMVAGGIGSSIGTASNFYGTGGTDQFFRTAGGQLAVAEFDAQNHLVAGGLITFPNGGAVGLDNASTVIGTGQNLYGSGGHDIFLRNSTGQLVILEINNANQWITGNPSAGNSVSVTYGSTNAVLNLSNAALINFTQGAANDTVNGSNDVIQTANGVSLTVNGGANAITAGQANYLTLGGGDGNTLTLGDNGYLGVSGGNGDIITAGANAMIGVSGSNNDTLNLGTNNSLWLTNSTGSTVNGSNEGIYALANVSVTVNGGGNNIGAADGDAITVAGNGQWGSSDLIAMSNGTLHLAHDAVATLTGSNNNVTTDQNDLIAINGGDHNTATLGSNSMAWVQAGNSTVINASGTSIALGAGTINTSVLGNNDYIYASAGSSFNVTGSGHAIIGSNLTVYLNAGDSNITVQGDNDVIHIRNGVTGQILGTNDSVMVDNVINAHNGDTIANYNGTSDLIDIAGLPFDTTITATPVLNAAHTSGQLVVADHGVTVATINLASVTNVGSFTVRSDGAGGTLIVDPPVSQEAGAALPGEDPAGAFHAAGQGVTASPTVGAEHAPGTNPAASADGDNFHFDFGFFRDAAQSAVQAIGRVVGITDSGNFDFSTSPNQPGHQELPVLPNASHGPAEYIGSHPDEHAVAHDSGLLPHDPSRPLEVPVVATVTGFHHDLI